MTDIRFSAVVLIDTPQTFVNTTRKQMKGFRICPVTTLFDWFSDVMSDVSNSTYGEQKLVSGKWSLLVGIRELPGRGSYRWPSSIRLSTKKVVLVNSR